MPTAYTMPGMHVTERYVDAPLDWAAPDGESIRLFVRELVDPRRRHEDLPLLAYLQGGPGGKSPRPQRPDGWIGRALAEYRLILVDQRGTARSTRITGQRIASFADADEAARYLLRFRADSIVDDMEHVRSTVYEGRRWSTLGQSYGGFLTLTYLSRAPEGLEACYVTSGLASVLPSAEEVYRRTFPRARAKTERYYRMFPADRERVAAVADFVSGHEVRLPGGDLLTVRRLQTLGLDLGMSLSAERMHWLFEEAWTDESPAPRALGDSFLDQVQRRTSFWDNPLFAVLQESIYGSGPGATAWAAQRERERHPDFDEVHRPLMFTGEMMFPFMFDEFDSLRAFAPAAEALARVEEYPELYDLERLASNEVPLNAVAYYDDMYVDSGLQADTADRVGNTRLWMTNEYEHDGIHRDEHVLDRLLRLRDLS